MSKIKHISFDLWLTLIKSHPEFKQKRSELILKTFDLELFDASSVNAQIRSVDKIFDRYNEISGKKVSAITMYQKILQKIVPNGKDIPLESIVNFRKQVDQLFLEYPPQFLNDNIPTILFYLIEDNYTLNLSSNTGFIEGEILRKALSKMDVLKYFNFLVFSDEIEVSKPSSYFFQKVYDGVGGDKKAILHIGDNPKADYQGAKNFGFDALLITNSNYSIDDIKSKL